MSCLTIQHTFYDRVHNANLLPGHSVLVKIYCFRLKFPTVTAFKHLKEPDFQRQSQFPYRPWDLMILTSKPKH